jgi:hypothetical protein
LPAWSTSAGVTPRESTRPLSVIAIQRSGCPEAAGGVSILMAAAYCCAASGAAVAHTSPRPNDNPQAVFIVMRSCEYRRFDVEGRHYILRRPHFLIRSSFVRLRPMIGSAGDTSTLRYLVRTGHTLTHRQRATRFSRSYTVAGR